MILNYDYSTYRGSVNVGAVLHLARLDDLGEVAAIVINGIVTRRLFMCLDGEYINSRFKIEHDKKIIYLLDESGEIVENDENEFYLINVVRAEDWEILVRK